MTISIDQALLQHFDHGNFALDMVFENGDYAVWNGTTNSYQYRTGAYKTTIGRPYVELLVIQNDVTPYSLKHSDQTDGIMRIILQYPLNQGAVLAKMKADEIVQAFKLGQSLSYGGVKLTIMGSSRGPGAPEESWYKISLTLPYRAFLTR